MFRFLKSTFVFLAAIIILFEEWLWDPLMRLMLAFSRLPLAKQLSAAIAGLSPRAAMLVYLGPMILLFPFKIGGLWLIGHGHALLGLATFLAAKVVGTALFAWLFNLTKPALIQIPWFARSYAAIHVISEAAHVWIHRQPLYQRIRALMTEIRMRFTPKRRRGKRLP